MIQDDYFELLKSGEEHLKNIKDLEQNLPNNKHLHLEINKSIRYFASDIESALDYIAYDFFLLYTYPVLLEQKKTKNAINHAKRKVSFPSSVKEKYFNNAMKNSFPHLQKNCPKLFSQIKNVQPFNYKDLEDSWLYKINNIANISKHRHLTKTEHYPNGRIEYFRYQGLTLKNISFRQVDNAINIGGITLTPQLAKKMDAEFIGEIETISLFTDSGDPVIKTLDSILKNATKLITDLSRMNELMHKN